jgi:acyl-CoA reductase-like NAD-dependent aldehyde dehydrogenase
MCTNTDYVLCPKHMVPKLMTAFQGALAEFYPPGTNYEPGKTEFLSQMVHTAAYDRIVRLIDSAEQSGCKVVGNQRDAEKRRIGLTLVEFNSKDENSPLVNEELFGPILPIVPVEVSLRKIHVPNGTLIFTTVNAIERGSCHRLHQR